MELGEPSSRFEPQFLEARDYGGLCWWCGATADSAEHRYKKTDLVREFGQTSFAKQEHTAIEEQGGSRTVRGGRGPNSKTYKFKKSLCSTCNGARSQPFDQAYDRFMEAVLKDERTGFRTKRRIDLKEIWANGWEDEYLNVMRYFAKHAACRVVEDCGIEITPEVTGFLDGQEPPAFLSFDFNISSDMAGVIAAYEPIFKERFSHVGNGPIFPHVDDRFPGQPIGIEGDMTVRWFRTHWYYGTTIDGFGDPSIDGVIYLNDDHAVRGELRTRLALTPKFLLSKARDWRNGPARRRTG